MAIVLDGIKLSALTFLLADHKPTAAEQGGPRETLQFRCFIRGLTADTLRLYIENVFLEYESTKGNFPLCAQNNALLV